MICIALKDRAGREIARTCHENEVTLCADREYQEGDHYELTGPSHLWIRADVALPEGEVYLPQGCMRWTVPFGEHRLAYAPAAFTGTRHLFSAREMQESEIRTLRCISRNPSDLRGDTDFFPHCTANVETRNESCFAARNTVDGILLNHFHGEWPFQSWGIGTREDACLTLDLGRTVTVEKAALVLRADFPHDAYWVSGELLLDDGSAISFPLERTGERQWVDLQGAHRIRQVRLTHLIKSNDPSAFPALTQLELYGKDE